VYLNIILNFFILLIQIANCLNCKGKRQKKEFKKNFVKKIFPNNRTVYTFCAGYTYCAHCIGAASAPSFARTRRGNAAGIKISFCLYIMRYGARIASLFENLSWSGKSALFEKISRKREVCPV
jgi:hypothetical protein